MIEITDFNRFLCRPPKGLFLILFYSWRTNKQRVSYEGWLDYMRKYYPKIKLYKVNVDYDLSLVDRYGVEDGIRLTLFSGGECVEPIKSRVKFSTYEDCQDFLGCGRLP